LQELQRLIEVLLAFYFVLLALKKKNVRDYFIFDDGLKEHLENKTNILTFFCERLFSAR